MKTVIVPSTGKPSHIDNYAVVNEIFPKTPIHYVYLDIRAVPDNYNDLMTICRDGAVRGNFSKDCCDAVASLGSCGYNCTASVAHIYGDSAPVFRNYLEYSKADLVLFDQAQLSDHPHFRQQEILKMIIRSGAEFLYIPSNENTAAAGTVHMKSTSRVVVSHAYPASKIATGKYKPGTVTTVAPASVRVSYESVDNLLSDLQEKVVLDNILIHQVSRTRRYFLKQSNIVSMLQQSKKEILWLKN